MDVCVYVCMYVCKVHETGDGRYDTTYTDPGLIKRPFCLLILLKIYITSYLLNRYLIM